MYALAYFASRIWWEHSGTLTWGKWKADRWCVVRSTGTVKAALIQPCCWIFYDVITEYLHWRCGYPQTVEFAGYVQAWYFEDTGCSRKYLRYATIQASGSYQGWESFTRSKDGECLHTLSVPYQMKTSFVINECLYRGLAEITSSWWWLGASRFDLRRSIWGWWPCVFWNFYNNSP